MRLAGTGDVNRFRLDMDTFHKSTVVRIYYRYTATDKYTCNKSAKRKSGREAVSLRGNNFKSRIFAVAAIFIRQMHKHSVQSRAM